jgi:hypothetical protein
VNEKPPKSAAAVMFGSEAPGQIFLSVLACFEVTPVEAAASNEGEELRRRLGEIEPPDRALGLLGRYKVNTR